MKERIKGVFTKKKIFHFLKMALFVVALSLILLSLLGTVAHATGLVDDTINAENLYSKYPLSNYQLDFFVDNSWSWLPWNWLDGIGKSVQYGLYCITNFVWTISLYLSNATGYVVQEAYKLDFINDMADSIGKSIQTLAGVTQNGFSSTGFYVGLPRFCCKTKKSACPPCGLFRFLAFYISCMIRCRSRFLYVCMLYMYVSLPFIFLFLHGIQNPCFPAKTILNSTCALPQQHPTVRLKTVYIASHREK